MKYSTNKVDIHISHKCNLACVGCNHFSDFVDIDGDIDVDDKQFLKDIDMITKKINISQSMQILGGEPLLKKNFKEVFTAALKILQNNNFDFKKLFLYTNGLLLHKNLYIKNLVDDYGFRIKITFHPNKNSKLYDTLKKNLFNAFKNMKCFDWVGSARHYGKRDEQKITIDTPIHWQKTYLERKGKIYPHLSDDIKSSYKFCTCPHAQVRDGKIYKCAPIAYLPFALKNTKQLDTKYWKPYLDYTPASLDNDDELEQFFLTHKKPESICSMCPSSPKYYEKYDRKIK